MTTSNESTAPIVRAADAEVLSGASIKLFAETEQLLSGSALLEAGSAGVPPHYHLHSTELFHLLAGSMRVLAGETLATLHAGDVLVVPPQTVHALAPTSGTDAEFFVVTTPPAKRFDYYRLLDRVRLGEADPQELADSQERFDSYFVESPTWDQARSEEQSS